MIALEKLRELNLLAAPSRGRPLHLSAASGLVRIDSHLYVVADDELHLGVFAAGNRKPGHLIRLFDGVLPESKPDRKARKPDLEALTLLPAGAGFPHGALLALGSGSMRNRRAGVLLRLDSQGAIAGGPCVIDLSTLFDSLAGVFPVLNIEGAVIRGGELCLFQRGNKTDRGNAMIRFPFPALLDLLHGKQTGMIEPIAIQLVDLGQAGEIPFSFTDASALPDGGIVFTAVAEDTGDSYNDGLCVAAAIGLLDNDGHLEWLRQLDQPHKIEGVDAHVDGDTIKLLLVTDADDAGIPACLFAAAVKK